jgi:hypothetical protein
VEQMKKLLMLCGVAVLLIGIGACGGGSNNNSAPTPGATTPGGATATGPGGTASPGTISPRLPRLPRVANPQGAIKGLTLGTCNTGAGTQKVTGQVKSPARNRADFLVSVAWTTDRGDVLGRGYAVIRNVPGGASRPFAISAKVADGATRCVPNVQYGRIA